MNHEQKSPEQREWDDYGTSKYQCMACARYLSRDTQYCDSCKQEMEQWNDDLAAEAAEQQNACDCAPCFACNIGGCEACYHDICDVHDVHKDGDDGKLGCPACGATCDEFHCWDCGWKP